MFAASRSSSHGPQRCTSLLEELLEDGAHHRVFDPSVMQIDADFVVGLEAPVWLFWARHGGDSTSRHIKKSGAATGNESPVVGCGEGTDSTLLDY